MSLAAVAIRNQRKRRTASGVPPTPPPQPQTGNSATATNAAVASINRPRESGSLASSTRPAAGGSEVIDSEVESVGDIEAMAVSVAAVATVAVASGLGEVTGTS